MSSTVTTAESTTSRDISLTPLETSILQALAYADVFEFALNASEIHRYLVGMGADEEDIRAALNSPRLIPQWIEQHGELYTLPGRGDAAAARQRRQTIAARVWPNALRYARLIAQLPFVRMVAVTGALAVDNVELEADIDLLIVTQPGRLWLCRALVIAVVKLARQRGDTICPNYFLSERALALGEQNLFTAHEFAQMVPLAGEPTYHQMHSLNRWVEDFLPNTNGATMRYPVTAASGYPVKSLLETALNMPPGGWLERWEMARKIRKFGQQAGAESTFNADCCKGHFDQHGQRILSAYQTRLESLR